MVSKFSEPCGVIERAYNRGDLFDKRRSLMEAWGNFACNDKSNVTHLRKSI